MAATEPPASGRRRVAGTAIALAAAAAVGGTIMVFSSNPFHKPVSPALLPGQDGKRRCSGPKIPLPRLVNE